MGLISNGTFLTQSQGFQKTGGGPEQPKLLVLWIVVWAVGGFQVTCPSALVPGRSTVFTFSIFRSSWLCPVICFRRVSFDCAKYNSIWSNSVKVTTMLMCKNRVIWTAASTKTICQSENVDLSRSWTWLALSEHTLLSCWCWKKTKEER